MKKILHEIESMSDAALQATWETLDRSRPDDPYDTKRGITMRQYIDALRSEMKRRGLPTS